VTEDGNGYAELDQLIYDLNHDFEAALDDDLNIAGAMAALFEFIGKVNSPMSGGMINGSDSRKILATLESINNVIAVMDFNERAAPEAITALLEKRNTARKLRRWEEADILRSELAALNVEVLDTRQGTIWHYK
jgi:cysteinyl-tRNA synthetase